MVRKIEWTKRALIDLEEIHEFIARDSKKYAQIQVIKIRESVSNLLEFPLMGRRVPEFPQLPYREIISGNYRVIYRYDKKEDKIYVMAVIHGKRLLNNIIQ